MDWIDETIGRRVFEGIKKYGAILPQTNNRCFRKEAFKKLLDSLDYISSAYKKGELTQKQHIHLCRNIKGSLRALQLACEDRFQMAMWRLNTR
jgi:hypothetical protein